MEIVSPGDAATRDRLSALPDDLLHRILRFLDSRQPVRDLSRLSRRWRHLWASSPFVTLQSSSGNERFGNSLLLLRDPTELHAFCLHSSDANHVAHQRKWLRHAMNRGLRVLEFTSRNRYQFQLPDCAFNCATLEEINIRSIVHREVIAPKSVCLPLLKKLHLQSVQIEPSIVEKLCAGCPALEDLNLSQCSLASFKISSDTLKTLSITFCTYVHLHISAPNTVSMRLTVSGKVHLDGMPSLGSAWVYVCDNAVDHLVPCAYDLFAVLSSAHHLELFRFDLLLQYVVAKSGTESLSFRNLKSLYIGEWLVADFDKQLAYFIQFAPNLAHLTLDQLKLYDRHKGNLPRQVSREKKPCDKLQQVPALPRKLETLQIRISKGDDIQQVRRMRALLKEKTKPKETEVEWF